VGELPTVLSFCPVTGQNVTFTSYIYAHWLHMKKTKGLKNRIPYRILEHKNVESMGRREKFFGKILHTNARRARGVFNVDRITASRLRRVRARAALAAGDRHEAALSFKPLDNSILIRFYMPRNNSIFIRFYMPKNSGDTGETVKNWGDKRLSPQCLPSFFVWNPCLPSFFIKSLFCYT